MNKIMSAVKAFLADENGVTAIEYGLLAAVMGAAIAIAVGALSGGLAAAFTAIGTLIAGAFL